jgi:hypothetical protein
LKLASVKVTSAAAVEIQKSGSTIRTAALAVTRSGFDDFISILLLDG